MSEPSPTRRARRGRVPRLVLAATVAFGALAACWSVLAPLGEAPDEPAHLALVLHLADGNPYPDYDGLHNQVAIIRLCKTFASATRACPRPGEQVTATSMRLHPLAEAPDKAHRPAWDDEGGAEPIGQLNQMPQHPPLYYQAMATVLRVERAVHGGPWSTDRELALLRLANALLITPLPLLCWWAGRRFGLDDRAASLAGLSAFAVPMLTHIGSTLNNDNLLTLVSFALVALLAGVVRGDRSTRTAVGVGVLGALGLLTKAFAAVFPPLVALAYLLGWLVARSETAPADPSIDDLEPPQPTGPLGTAGWRGSVRALAIAGAVTVAGAAWWYLGVKHRTGSFAPSIEGQRLTADLQPPGFEPHVSTFLQEFVPKLTQRFWGSFGWYTIRIPMWQASLLAAVGLGALAVALAPRRTADGSSRLQRAFLLTPVLALGAFVALRAWSLHVTTGQFPFIQGRYLFAGLAGAFVLVGVALRHLELRAATVADTARPGRPGGGRWGTAVVVGLAAVVQLDAMRRCLQGWWGGPGLGPIGQLRAMVAWSGWPGEVVALLAAVALAAGTWLVVEVARDLRPVGSDAA